MKENGGRYIGRPIFRDAFRPHLCGFKPEASDARIDGPIQHNSDYINKGVPSTAAFTEVPSPLKRHFVYPMDNSEPNKTTIK